MKKNKLKWEFSAGFYPGLLMGMRSYKYTKKNDHVIYLPLVDFCFTIYK